MCNRAAKGSRLIGRVVPTRIQQFGVSRDDMLAIGVLIAPGWRHAAIHLTTCRNGFIHVAEPTSTLDATQTNPHLASRGPICWFGFAVALMWSEIAIEHQEERYVNVENASLPLCAASSRAGMAGHRLAR